MALLPVIRGFATFIGAFTRDGAHRDRLPVLRAKGFTVQKNRMTLILLAASFVTGTAIGYQALANHGVWSWLVEPGVLLALPLYSLVGGVHGGFPRLWWQAIAPCNGLAYATIMAIGLWARRCIQRKRA
jgi:hypothetical protein